MRYSKELNVAKNFKEGKLWRGPRLEGTRYIEKRNQILFICFLMKRNAINFANNLTLVFANLVKSLFLNIIREVRLTFTDGCLLESLWKLRFLI